MERERQPVHTGIEITGNHDINQNIKILALELVMIKAELRGFVYDNKKGNKTYVLAKFRDRMDKLYTLCIYENIKPELKKHIYIS